MRLAALLDPDPAPPSPVVRPADVGGHAAWADLLRAGALDLLHDEAGVAGGTVVTAEHRALALGALVPARCVVAGRSAAWVHTGLLGGRRTVRLPAGAVTDVAYAAGTHRPAPAPGLELRQAQVLDRDTTYVAGVPVLMPTRTAMDVACRVPHPEAVALLIALAGAGADLRLAARRLEQRQRVVGRPAARRALTEALATPRG